MCCLPSKGNGEYVSFSKELAPRSPNSVLLYQVVGEGCEHVPGGRTLPKRY